jgi:hypothetical protein
MAKWNTTSRTIRVGIWGHLVFAEFLPGASLFLLNGVGTINVLQVTNKLE